MYCLIIGQCSEQASGEDDHTGVAGEPEEIALLLSLGKSLYSSFENLVEAFAKVVERKRAHAPKLPLLFIWTPTLFAVQRGFSRSCGISTSRLSLFPPA